MTATPETIASVEDQGTQTGLQLLQARVAAALFGLQFAFDRKIFFGNNQRYTDIRTGARLGTVGISMWSAWTLFGGLSPEWSAHYTQMMLGSMMSFEGLSRLLEQQRLQSIFVPFGTVFCLIIKNNWNGDWSLRNLITSRLIGGKSKML